MISSTSSFSKRVMSSWWSWLFRRIVEADIIHIGVSNLLESWKRTANTWPANESLSPREMSIIYVVSLIAETCNLLSSSISQTIQVFTRKSLQ